MSESAVEVILLKPFVFSQPPAKGQKIPTEFKFMPRIDPEAAKTGSPHRWLPTTIEIPKFIADHPWVKEDYADGAIEPPAVTRKRIAAAEEAAKEERKKNAKIIQQSEEAYRRTTVGAEVVAKRGAKVEDEFNTPVNQLGRLQGADIDPQALERELNTPVNELQQQQSGGKATSDEKE
jgi:hypothetical protein